MITRRGYFLFKIGLFLMDCSMSWVMVPLIQRDVSYKTSIEWAGVLGTYFSLRVFF